MVGGRVGALYGAGIDALFPEGTSPVTSAPWPRAGRSKKLKDYDTAAVRAAMAVGRLEDVDPRDLRSTQPSVTAPAVRHYLEGDDGLFADADQSGNQHPVIYRRRGPLGVENVILSGHHRAAAALLKGEPLKAIVAEGGFGGPR